MCPQRDKRSKKGTETIKQHISKIYSNISYALLTIFPIFASD
nr:MAG TPA: hypothetical protein [Bacteriophage sp.]